MSTFLELKIKYKELVAEKKWNNENMLIQLVDGIFLKKMGYLNTPVRDIKNSDTGEKEYIRFCEYTIESKKLYMMVLAIGKEVSNEEIKQMVNYIKNRNSGDAYGILTNGKQFVLVNAGLNEIKNGEEMNYCVFNIDLIKTIHKKTQQYLEYFSRTAIFERNATECFKAVAQFKIYRMNQGKSFNTYVSSLQSFFFLYADIKRKEYVDYRKVTEDDIVKYLKRRQKEKPENGKELKKKTTANNIYSHIAVFYRVMNDVEKVGGPSLSHNRGKVLKGFDNTIKSTELISYDVTDIEKIYQYMYESGQSIRNIAIVSLVVFIGLDRKYICSLKWKDIQFEKIKINQREISLCPILKKCFKILRAKCKNRVGGNIENESVFTTFYKGEILSLSESAYNDIFKVFVNIDPNDIKWQKICPQLLKVSLIREMYKANITAEMIMYSIGLEWKSIGDYIPMDEVYKKAKEGQNVQGNIDEILQDRHPFKHVLYDNQ